MKTIDLLTVLCVVAIVAAVLYGVVSSSRCADDTREECLADGNKAYVCESYVQQNCYDNDYD